MLVLSRKIGQEIVIDENIVIVVNRIAGNRVTLGIKAPEKVRIVRGELENVDKPESFSSSDHVTVIPARPIINPADVLLQRHQ